MERFTGEQLNEVCRMVINSLRPPVSFLFGRSILHPLIEWIRLHDSFNGVLIVLGLLRTGNLIRLLLVSGIGNWVLFSFVVLMIFEVCKS
ncbi:hypothetical protein HanRHA438_Chr06g0253861 [Helianthus annuus]|nr:hypothetical protein HanRHA438_Chr06g0253861 [Helianthus annuus]